MLLLRLDLIVIIAIMEIYSNSPEKWLHNWICYPSNRSKQIRETHTADSAGTQYTRQSLNEKQHTWKDDLLSVKPCMYVVFHSNFAAYIVCRCYQPCEFLGFVWTDCWGNKSNYVITSPANRPFQMRAWRCITSYPLRGLPYLAYDIMWTPQWWIIWCYTAPCTIWKGLYTIFALPGSSGWQNSPTRTTQLKTRLDAAVAMRVYSISAGRTLH